ncbi:MAG: hypothetical protein ACD_49C00074G0032 [uncultured bacterium (gcode 4)]|uniref:Uncharacterized protein n=1 Tax=uncultured bacterium (gcode 4) TaxID=1234023 RepID=K2AD40_9BACT|nr:MAG: hypothetical protein ACD_49C00074G0032 [uncultured bacterium (gcode 4)]
MQVAIKQDKIVEKYTSDTLTFEELQELQKIKKDILSWDFYTFNEVFDEV